MAKNTEQNPDFDDIVFRSRNKEYGAYVLRKNYSRTVIVSLLIAIVIIAFSIIFPFLSAKAVENRKSRSERQVEIKLENLDTPKDVIVPPQAPPPPPEEVVQQQKYVPPEVVDTLKPEEMTTLMTADQAQVEVKNEDVVEIVQGPKAEVAEVESEPEPFYVVEENPVFPGGQEALQKFIAENTHYPAVAAENNIQGKVIIKFCVTPKGGVAQVSVLKGVDPELDKEAIRVVNSLPAFKPGRQGGIAVPVWYVVPIAFQLKQN